MKPRFDALLPFYVNGSLSDADRTWVEDYLRENPRAAAELRWYESLRHKLLEDMPPVSSEVGLERTLSRIRAESRTATQPPRVAAAPAATPAAAAPGHRPAPTAPTGSALTRLRDWLATLVPQPVLRPALAGAFAVVLAQALVIGHMSGRSDDEASELRALKASVAADHGPYLKLNFKADARESDIRLLLVEVQGSLAAGPGQLGDYYVRVPASQFAASNERLKASPIVEAVAIVDGLPPREP